VRNYTSVESKANEIKMLLRHPACKGKTVIILEGNTDVKLFRSLLCPNCLTEPVDGKRNVKVIVKDIKESGVLEVLGVSDADFDNLLGIKSPTDSIFVTDLHDVEIMMLVSSALQEVIAEYTIDQEMYNKVNEGLINSITDVGYKIGVLRLSNHLHHLNMNFKGLHYEKFCDVNGIEVVFYVDKLIEILCERSKNLKQ
jgi:hypothetical protein